MLCGVRVVCVSTLVNLSRCTEKRCFFQKVRTAYSSFVVGEGGGMEDLVCDIATT